MEARRQGAELIPDIAPRILPAAEMKCEFSGCKIWPKISVYFLWPHHCRDHSCPNKGLNDVLLFPFVFCKDHVPDMETLKRSPFWREEEQKMREYFCNSGRKLPFDEMILQPINIYEENPVLN